MKERIEHRKTTTSDRLPASSSPKREGETPLAWASDDVPVTSHLSPDIPSSQPQDQPPHAMQQAAEPWAHWVTITDCNGTRMFKFVELRRTRREVLSIKMQLGALVVTSRRTFDIFDCQANKPIAGLTSPIGLQTFGRRLQEREEGNMDDRKRLSKLGVKARLRSLTRKAGVYLHMRQLLST